jgi:hypothetical protein
MANRIIVVLLGLTLAASSDAHPRHRAELQRQCRKAVAKLWPQWRFADLSVEVREWAKSQKEDPAVAYGDFDDDAKEDVALLIRPSARPSTLKIVVCLSSLGSRRPVVIERPYCSDGIARVSKGQRYYNYETDRGGTYPKDGIHAYCFEKAGATYIFTAGSFSRIVDSD